LNVIANFRPRFAEFGLVISLLAVGLGVGSQRLTVAGQPNAPVTSPRFDSEVKLTTVKFDAMIKQIASKQAKLTVVDAWATWCGPCKKNFPHLVEMHEKYSGKGIAFASLSLDDTTKPKQVAEATEFLREKKAEFANFILDETMDDAFEKLDITAIPAVFMFGPDGKIIRKFTLEDPNNQFTYEQVESAVQEFLAGKPITKGDAPKKP